MTDVLIAFAAGEIMATLLLVGVTCFLTWKYFFVD